MLTAGPAPTHCASCCLFVVDDCVVRSGAVLAAEMLRVGPSWQRMYLCPDVYPDTFVSVALVDKGCGLMSLESDVGEHQHLRSCTIL